MDHRVRYFDAGRKDVYQNSPRLALKDWHQGLRLGGVVFIHMDGAGQLPFKSLRDSGHFGRTFCLDNQAQRTEDFLGQHINCQPTTPRHAEKVRGCICAGEGGGEGLLQRGNGAEPRPLPRTRRREHGW